MKLVIRPYHALSCSIDVFTINGRDAYTEDFGSVKFGHTDEPFACELEGFEPNIPTKEVLERYRITREEFDTVCQELDDIFNSGFCNWCA